MNRGSLVALALLVLQPVVFFRRVLINPDQHIPFDLLGFHTPLADFIAYALRQGEFPLWDPFPYCGYPIHADVQAQLFYPPAWLAIALRNLGRPGTMFYWLEWQVVLHMMLAGLLTYGFLRRLGCTRPAALFGGTVFQLGAFFASQAQHLGAVAGTAWLPLAWWAVWELRERFTWRWSALLAMALALSFLAGFMATTIVVWAATALVAVVLRSWRAAPSFVWALPMVAMQLVPTWRWSPWSVASLRGEAMGAGTPLRALWSLLWPNYWGVYTPGDPAKFTGDYSFTFLYCYCGLGVLLLWLVSLVRGRFVARAMAVLAAVFFVLQSGSFLPGFDKFVVLLPGSLRGALYMNFFLGAGCLALVLAGALAADRLPARAVWVLALATAVELTWAGSGREMNSAENSWRNVTSETQVDRSPKTARVMEELARAQTPAWRLDALDLNYSFTMNASWRRLPTPNGDNPLAPLKVVELRRAFASGESWERQLPVAKPESPLLDFLNVRYLLAHHGKEDRAALAKAGWELAATTEIGTRVYRRESTLPRFFLTDSAAEPKPNGGAVRVLRYGLNSLELETDAPAAALLASSETMHPDWRAWVDGSPAELVLVKGAFRGLPVPAGRHRVRMAYEPQALGAWCGLALAAWGLAGWGAIKRPGPSNR